MFDGDIFRLLEDDISLYQNRGKIFLTGDLNGRTSIKPDFIENDRSIIIQNEVNQLDTPIPRFSLDRGSNRFGDFLLDLCKATNMRIVNGRLHKDQGSVRFTCFTHNGESVVDYVITLPQNFTLISEFQVHDFTEYSNHAPVSFTLKTHTHLSTNNRNEQIYYKWKPEHKDAFLRDISNDMLILN